MAQHAYQATGLKRLCMAGGVALNSVANGKILRQTPFEEIYIQPAAGDGGGAIGAALYAYHMVLGQPRRFIMEHAYWGEEHRADAIDKFLKEENIPYRPIRRRRKTAHPCRRPLAGGEGHRLVPGAV